jgi:hypothetical protein
MSGQGFASKVGKESQKSIFRKNKNGNEKDTTDRIILYVKLKMKKSNLNFIFNMIVS